MVGDKIKKGFTLVEILTVIGIFSLISGAVVGIFLLGVNSQKRILATQELLDQGSYVLEYMGKALRMAKKDDIEIGKITVNCLEGEKVNYEIKEEGRKIRFRNYLNQCQEFYLEGDKIMEKRGEADPLSLTSLKVLSLKFSLQGELQDDETQPRVTISLKIQGRGKNPPILTLQTTVSQRDLDVKY